MVLQIMLIIAIVLQIIAAIVAIRLTRITKFNSSWILFTIALTLMAFLRLGEYFQVVADKEWKLPPDVFVWIGVATSLCFAVALFLVKKLLTYIDFTEKQRRLTEKRILNTVIRTEEKERMRFAKELHDGLGPLLSSAKLSVSALAASKNMPENEEIIKNTSYVIDEAIRSLKEISNNLSPHVLNNFGLGRAVANFVNRLSPISPIDITYNTNLRGQRFDSDVEVILYRVICELINNSIRHSEATHMDIRLDLKDDTLLLDYMDDGVGFDREAAMEKGMGLSNMLSRISTLKGEFTIESSPGGGMKAHLSVKV